MAAIGMGIDVMYARNVPNEFDFLLCGFIPLTIPELLAIIFGVEIAVRMVSLITHQCACYQVRLGWAGCPCLYCLDLAQPAELPR